MNKWVQQGSGNKLDLDNLINNTYLISDIANNLANQCRFNGSTNKFYSVGQHSYYVSQMCTREHALEGLCHDIAESIMSDIVRPIKAKFKEVIDFDNELTKDMFTKLRLNWPIHDDVWVADNRMLHTEVLQLMPKCNPIEWGLKDFPPYDFIITPWTPTFAKEQFLDRYSYLSERRAVAAINKETDEMELI